MDKNDKITYIKLSPEIRAKLKEIQDKEQRPSISNTIVSILYKYLIEDIIQPARNVSRLVHVCARLPLSDIPLDPAQTSLKETAFLYCLLHDTFDPGQALGIFSIILFFLVKFP